MNKRKFNKVFKEIKEVAKMDYAIPTPDKYGDCNSCVNYALCEQFGTDSNGIWAKHWITGMNKGCAWKALDSVYIAHDITAEQAKIMVEVFEANGYTVTPRIYDPFTCYLVKEEANK